MTCMQHQARGALKSAEELHTAEKVCMNTLSVLTASLVKGTSLANASKIGVPFMRASRRSHAII